MYTGYTVLGQGEDNQGGDKISRDSLSPGGQVNRGWLALGVQAVQGGGGGQGTHDILVRMAYVKLSMTYPEGLEVFILV